MPAESRFGILIEAVNRARTALSEAERQVKQLQGTTDSAASSSARLTRASGELNSAIGAMNARVGAAVNGLSRFSQIAAFLSNPVGLAVVGVAALGLSLVGMAKSAADANEAMQNLEARTGFTAKTLGGLQVSAANVGQDFSVVVQGIDLFNRRLGEAQHGNQDAARAFQELGVAIRDSEGFARSNEAVLQDVARRLSEVENAAERSRLAFEIFGRSSAKLLATLNQDLDENKRKAEELGLVYSVGVAEALTKTDAAFDRAKIAMDGFGKSAGAIAAIVVTPALELWAAMWERIAKATKDAADAVGFLAGHGMPLPQIPRSGFTVGTGEEGVGTDGFVKFPSIPGGGPDGPMPPAGFFTRRSFAESASSDFQAALGRAALGLVGTKAGAGLPSGGFAGEMDAGGVKVDVPLSDFEDFISQFEDFESILERSSDSQGNVNERIAAFTAVMEESEPAWVTGVRQAQAMKGAILDFASAAGTSMAMALGNSEAAFRAIATAAANLLASIAASQFPGPAGAFLGGLLGGIPSLLMNQGGVLAASGFSYPRGGVRGFDSMLAVMQPGERTLSVRRNDQFEHLLNELTANRRDPFSSSGGGAREVNIRFEVDPNRSDLATDRWIREDVMPRIYREIGRR